MPIADHLTAAAERGVETSVQGIAPPRRTGFARVSPAWLSLLFTLAAAAAFGLLLGEDGSGDQRAFHVPAVWLFLHPHQDPAWGVGRMAGLTPSTWNVPWFLIAQSAPAWVAVVYLSILHGIAIWLSGAITWTAVKAASHRWRILLTCVVTLTSLAAPATLTEFATTFGNLTTAIPALGAVLVYLRRPPGPLSNARALCVGLLLGASFGLKFTNVVAVIAFIAAALVCELRGWRALRSLTVLALAIVLGALASGGYWAFLMWERFGNPIFPYYNGLFHSPYGPTNNIHDGHYATHWPWQALSLPFRMLSVRGYPSEWYGRDARWAILVVLALAATIYLAQRGIRRIEPVTEDCIISPRDRRFLLTFTAVGWVVWLTEFSVARYLVVLELLSTLVAFAMIDLMVRRLMRKVLMIVIVGVVILQYFVVPGWYRVDLAGHWYNLDVPKIARQHNLLALFPGSILFDFTVSGLPDDATAAKIPVAYDDHNPGISHGTGREDREIRLRIVGHKGPVVSITGLQEVEKAAHIAASYGFRLEKDRCEPLRTKFGDVEVCPWERIRTKSG